MPVITQDLPEIRRLIPHSDPMVLLDRLLAVDEHSLCAQVSITPDSLFYAAGAVAAWTGIEYMAQAIAAFAGYQAFVSGQDTKLGFLLGTRHYESHCSAFALNSVLHIHVQRVLQHPNGLGAFECRIVAAESQQLLAAATVTVFQPENVQAYLKGNDA